MLNFSITRVINNILKIVYYMHDDAADYSLSMKKGPVYDAISSIVRDGSNIRIS